jgi:hypothetical protein
MANKVRCEFHLAINEDGDWAVEEDAQEAANRLADNNGGACVRTIKISALVMPPEIADVEVDVPAEAGHTVEVQTGNEFVVGSRVRMVGESEEGVVYGIADDKLAYVEWKSGAKAGISFGDLIAA